MAVAAALLPPQAIHVDWQTFTSFPAFQEHLQRTQALWPSQVRDSLRLIVLNGILDPLSGAPVPAAALKLESANYRETLEHNGCISRHRAVLLVLQQLTARGELPAIEELQLYCPEAITPFAALLRRHFPRALLSEYLPDPADPRHSSIPHQDLCALSLPDACMDLVVCNDVFKHLYDLPAALSEIVRILRPGGQLVTTFHFAYNRINTIVKAHHYPGANPGVAGEAALISDPEFHGNPVDPHQGSLVYQIPGWDLLDQARACGFLEPTIHWIAAPSYGVVGQEIPAVMVLVARR